MKASETVDVLVVGAGIVGLAAARALSQKAPHLKIALYEKEAEVATHQTGHNSGVIHAGLYYKPESFKAQLCARGRALLVAYCEEQAIPFEICGKLVLAIDASELGRLDALYERGVANGLTGMLRLPADAIADYEPQAKGVAALHVPETGIVDYGVVARHYARDLASSGVTIARGERVIAIGAKKNGRRRVEATTRVAEAKYVVTCGGLESDRIAKLAGIQTNVTIVPFRGEYYELIEARRGLVKNLIYPVPDPSFPFLGVHFTRMISGGIEAGPNAVLALAREGYRWRDVSLPDSLETLAFPGFWRLAAKYFKTGAYEVWRSLSKTAFTRSLQRLVPNVTYDDLIRAGSGVRAQAMLPDGSLVDDFAFEEADGVLAVLNAPSPAATASLAIGEVIAERVLDSIKTT